MEHLAWQNRMLEEEEKFRIYANTQEGATAQHTHRKPSDSSYTSGLLGLVISSFRPEAGTGGPGCTSASNKSSEVVSALSAGSAKASAPHHRSNPHPQQAAAPLQITVKPSSVPEDATKRRPPGKRVPSPPPSTVIHPT